jgi:hypothetical protein
MPGGWMERCAVTITAPADSAPYGTLSFDRGSDFRFAIAGSGGARLRYLLDAAAGGAWVRSWDSLTDSPLAIGLLAPSDSLMLRIGPRG